MSKIHKYIAEYFFIAQKVVKTYNPNNIVVIQFFQKKENAILSGINETLDLLESELTLEQKARIQLSCLKDGALIQPKEVVLEMKGHYQDFGIFEGLIDGILARATSLATNAKRCIEAAKGKEIICMSDRSDHYLNQERDGYSFIVGGINSFSSWAQAHNPENKVYGSIPHALIQNFQGDLVQCMEHYQSLYPQDELVGLVDYHNDVITDSLLLLDKFKHKLCGVRVDTSQLVKDKMFEDESDSKKELFGVNPTQIKKLRQALNEAGGTHVKIFVSSGFTPEKIKFFEDNQTPADGYGVGEYLLQINHSFCADATKLNDKNEAKVGRAYSHNPNLIPYQWK